MNNAGYGLLGAVEEGSAEEIEDLYRTNVFGLLNVTRAVLPSMRKQRSGHIINMSSVGGYASGEQLEGVIAKRKDSRYESGKRSGSWAKYRLNHGQELVIGGYVPGPHGLDSMWLLSPGGAGLYRQSQERIRASHATTGIPETAHSGGAELSVRESS